MLMPILVLVAAYCALLGCFALMIHRRRHSGFAQSSARKRGQMSYPPMMQLPPSAISMLGT
jgi:hypothetical protein